MVGIFIPASIYVGIDLQVIGDNDDDPVDVIGHHTKYIQFDNWKSDWQFLPFLQDHSSRIVQAHLLADYVAKQARPILRTDGNEIRPSLRIIMPF